MTGPDFIPDAGSKPHPHLLDEVSIASGPSAALVRTDDARVRGPRGPARREAGVRLERAVETAEVAARVAPPKFTGTLVLRPWGDGTFGLGIASPGKSIEVRQGTATTGAAFTPLCSDDIKVTKDARKAAPVAFDASVSTCNAVFTAEACVVGAPPCGRSTSFPRPEDRPRPRDARLGQRGVAINPQSKRSMNSRFSGS